MDDESVTNAMPKTLQQLLVKLTFIGNIDKGIKINTHDMSVSDANSWIARIARTVRTFTFTTESRKTMIIAVEQLVDESIKAIEQYSSSPFRKEIVNALDNATSGISNLMDTYSADLIVKSKLEVILKNISIQLEKNQNYLEGRK